MQGALLRRCVPAAEEDPRCSPLLPGGGAGPAAGQAAPLHAVRDGQQLRGLSQTGQGQAWLCSHSV